MSEKGKVIDVKRKYRKNLWIMLSNMTLLAVVLALFVVDFIRGHLSIPLSAVLIFAFIGCIYHIFRIYYLFLYKEPTTLYSNANYILKQAEKLARVKRLNLYAGLFINIADFRYINQRYGLDKAKSIITLCIQDFDSYTKLHNGYAAILGGDNFFVLIKKDKLNDFLDHLKKVYVPIEVDGSVSNIHVKFRCGINQIQDNENLSTVIFFASIAMDLAKSSFQDAVYFENAMLENFMKIKKLIADSKQGLRNHEFFPMYQPKVDAQQNMLCGCEALVRWKHNDILVQPGDFIPALEKSGRIVDVDYHVFELVCNDITNWIKAGIEPVRVSVNFSKLHLKTPDFLERILEIKKRYNVDGKYLEIEFTESAGVTDFDVVKEFTNEIKKEGISISIDDFGTGYSSLSMLQLLNADVVKMDKSFLDNSFRAGNEQFIVDIINIIKHQNEKVLFEGVETQEQLEFLRQSGCDIIQGYFFDKPLVRTEFEDRLRNKYYKI